MKETPAIHAEVNDFVRKDGILERIMEIDVPEGCYYTNDGGLIGFHEVGADNVFLESEVYDELAGISRMPSRPMTNATGKYHADIVREV